MSRVTMTLGGALLVPTLAVLALVAGACGGGDSAEPMPTTAPTTTAVPTTTASPATTEAPDEPLATTTTAAPVESTTNEASDEPLATTTTAAPVETTTTTTTIVLTDSFRGVTAETIKVGFASIDFEGFNETYGFNLTYANYDDTVDVYVDHINATGGILGRVVELVHAHFLPVGPVTAEAACIELTQDHRVFAVMNGFAGPGVENVNSCFGATYDTILVGGKPTPEQLAQTTAPWISYDISLGRRGRAFVNLLEETGELDGLGPIMVLGANLEYEPMMADVEDALTTAGAEVPISVANPNTGDQAASVAFLEVLLERARGEGVETIFTVGEAAYALQYLFTLGDEFTVLILNGDSLNRWATAPPEGVERSGRLLTNKSFESRDDPDMADCVAIVEAGLGHEVRSPDMLEEGEKNFWAALQNTCKSFELFRHIATAAGPDLTNDSFRAAAEALDTFSFTGTPFASLGPDKVDARDTLSLAEWDHEAGDWVALSPPVNVR